MACSTDCQSNSIRPTIGQAASSPTAVANILAAATLVAAFFLPHGVDANGSQIVPIAVAKQMIGGSRPWLPLIVVLWPYGFATATLFTFATLAFLRPRWHDSALIGLPICTGLCLVTGWLLLLFNGATESRLAMAIAAIIIPSGACIAARMIWLYRAGLIAASAAWGQSFSCVLAAFSLRWLWNPSITKLSWGGYVGIIGAMLMLVASWCWQTRTRHDLFDRSVAPRTYQLSLLQLILAIALIAIALAYWQSIEA